MPEKINSFSIKSTPPKPLGINKRLTLIAVGVLCFVLLFLIVSAVTTPATKKEIKRESTHSSMPTEVISSLPKDYENWVSEKPVLLQNRDSNQARGVLSAEEKFLQDERVKKLKRAVQARESSMFVSGVKVEKKFTRLQGKEGESKESYNQRDVFNRQDEKIHFLYKTRKNETFLNSTLQEKRSPYELMAGSLIPGVLLTGLNSDLPGEILGQVSRNVFDTVSGKNLLIPQGTKILGKYDSKISYGQERILIVWTRLIYPDGKSIVLEGMPGVDLSGYAGLKDKVNNHWGRLLSGVVLGSVLGASAQIARGGNRTIDPSFGQLALEGTAQNLNQAGQQITRRNLNVQPTLEVRPGSRFHIFVTKDIVLANYTMKN